MTNFFGIETVHLDIVGYALMHFVWQGLALAIVGASICQLVSSARGRYWILCSTLLAMTIAPVVTFLFLSDGPGTGEIIETVGASANASLEITPGSIDDSVAAPADGVLETMLSPRSIVRAVPLFWAIGVIFLSIKLLGGYLQLRSVSYRDTRMADSTLSTVVDRLRERLGLRRQISLRVSESNIGPYVFGFLKPVIVVPAAMLANLPYDQVESILIHELAHIRRNDYIINVWQNFVETVLFYHPAIWWVSSQIRKEREHCCDDEVVQNSVSISVYSRALTDLEQVVTRVGRLAPAATEHGLKQRILRLVYGESSTIRSSRTYSLLPLALAVVVVLLVGSCTDFARLGESSSVVGVELPADIQGLIQDGKQSELIDVLYRHLETDGQDALPIVVTAFETSTDTRMRESIGFVMSYFFTPEADQYLLSVAQHDPSVDVRRSALRAFRLRLRGIDFLNTLPIAVTTDDIKAADDHYAKTLWKNKGLVPRLRQIVTDTSQPINVRSSALSLVGAHPENIVETISIASNNPEPRLRTAAVFALTHHDVEVDVILDLLKAESDVDVIASLTYALGYGEYPEGIPVLADLARNTSNDKIRQFAFQGLWLAAPETDGAEAALEMLKKDGLEAEGF